MNPICIKILMIFIIIVWTNQFCCPRPRWFGNWHTNEWLHCVLLLIVTMYFTLIPEQNWVPWYAILVCDQIILRAHLFHFFFHVINLMQMFYVILTSIWWHSNVSFMVTVEVLAEESISKLTEVLYVVD